MLADMVSLRYILYGSICIVSNPVCELPLDFFECTYAATNPMTDTTVAHDNGCQAGQVLNRITRR